jgi:hypothetical protein
MAGTNFDREYLQAVNALSDTAIHRNCGCCWYGSRPYGDVARPERVIEADRAIKKSDEEN